MKKEITMSALFIALIFTLTACSNSQSENNSTKTTTAQQTEVYTDKAETAPAQQTSETETAPVEQNTKILLENEDFSFSYDGDHHEVFVDAPTAKNVSSLNFNCSYIIYDYPQSSWDGSLVKVKEGDRFDEALTVTEAESNFIIRDNEYVLWAGYVWFDGTLTLTGTLHCVQEDSPIDGGGQTGNLYFIPDADNKVKVPYGPAGDSQTAASYYLGKVTDEDMPKGITEIVNTDGKAEARVKAAISHINVNYFFGKFNNTDSATLESVEALDGDQISSAVRTAPNSSEAASNTAESSQEKTGKLLENEDFSFSKAGETIYVDADAPTAEELTYVNLDCAYIIYDNAQTPWNGTLMKVKEGDWLDQRLIVKSASSKLVLRNNEYILWSGDVWFEGTLRLTGTIRCIQTDDPVHAGKGELWFVPDADNKVKTPSNPKDRLAPDIKDEYFLGKVTDENMPEGIAEIVNTDGKAEARVEAQISHIRVNYSYGKDGTYDSANLDGIEAID